MLAIRALNPVLTNPSLFDPISLQLLHNIFPANADCKTVANHICAVLPLNTLQRLVMEGVFNHVIPIKEKLCVTREDELLLYIKEEKGLRKSCMIYAQEMGFTLLDKRNEIMLAIPTKCTAEGIKRNTVDTGLSISIRKTKSLCINVSAI